MLRSLVETDDSIRNSKSMKLLAHRLSSSDIAESLAYRVKNRQGVSHEHVVKIEEEKALKEVKGMTVCISYWCAIFALTEKVTSLKNSHRTLFGH